jgi:hypothetical protein
MNIMRVYPDDVSLKAMENYAKIANAPEYNPGGCVYHGFVSFMIRGVEKYCDEAMPFEAFKNRGRSPPNPEMSQEDLAEFRKTIKGIRK